MYNGVTASPSFFHWKQMILTRFINRGDSLPPSQRIPSFRPQQLHSLRGVACPSTPPQAKSGWRANPPPTRPANRPGESYHHYTRRRHYLSPFGDCRSCARFISHRCDILHDFEQYTGPRISHGLRVTSVPQRWQGDVTRFWRDGISLGRSFFGSAARSSASMAPLRFWLALAAHDREQYT